MPPANTGLLKSVSRGMRDVDADADAEGGGIGLDIVCLINGVDQKMCYDDFPFNEFQ